MQMLLKNVYSLYNVDIEKICGRRGVVIWGIGETGHQVYMELVRGGILDCIGFYDNNTNGRTHCFGIEILNRDKLEKLDRNTPIIIAVLTQSNYQEIAWELNKLGFKWIFTPYGFLHIPRIFDVNESKRMLKCNEEDIDIVYNLLEDDKSKEVYKKIFQYRTTNDFYMLRDLCEKNYEQYFPVGEIYEPDENEVFIDGGCLDAGTIEGLKKWTNDTYKKVYAFEPAKEDRIIAQEYIDYRDYRAELIEAGLYSKKAKLSFSTLSCGSSKITEDGIETIDVISIDEFMENKADKITLIKMDIEGSELAALEGAVKTISRDKPKLAISIYHKFEDMWIIPLWLHKHFPEYKFYIRHHSYMDTETVLYAVAK